jgi:hypothetical protein
VLPERHLGLVLPEEVGQIDAMLDTMAEQLDLDMQAWDALPETQFALAPVAIPRLLEGKKLRLPVMPHLLLSMPQIWILCACWVQNYCSFLRLPISLFLPKPMPCICLAVIPNCTRRP